MLPLMSAGSSLLVARSSLLCITCLAGAPEFRSNFEGTRCFVENLSSDTDWAMLKDHFRDDNQHLNRESRDPGHGSRGESRVKVVEFVSLYTPCWTKS